MLMGYVAGLECLLVLMLDFDAPVCFVLRKAWQYVVNMSLSCFIGSVLTLPM